MTTLLCNLLLYAGIGCLEWYLALRRTLACARGEKATLVALVFAENLLGLFVLVNFVRDSDWFIAVVYSIGASLGALLVSDKEREFQHKDGVGAPPDGTVPHLAPRSVPAITREIVIWRSAPPLSVSGWRRGMERPPAFPYGEGSLVLEDNGAGGMDLKASLHELGSSRGRSYTPLPARRP